MKNRYPTLTILSLILISVSCNEDLEPIQKKVSIDFTVSSENETIKDLPPDSRLILNVQTSNGETVLEYQEVAFEFRENHFYTKPLDLRYGNYTITDIMIVNADDDILYAAPKLSGTLGSSVEHPLDFNFVFSSASGPSGMNLRLMDVRKYRPGDFGYGCFKKPGSKLTVIVNAEGSQKAISGHAFILNENDTVAHYKLSPKINQIRVPARINEDYTLVVSSDGYASVRYSLSDVLQASGNKKPLRVVLTPAFTMLAFIDLNSSTTFDFYLGGPEGTSVSIDWGEGTTQSFAIGGDTNITHEYAAGGNYPITITGDIEKITYFYSFYGQGMVDAISFRQLTALEEIRFGLTRGPRVLDLSHNTKLQFALLAGLGDMEKLYLPPDHELRDLMISGPNKITTAGIDAIIRNVYRNTVDKNITNGSFGLSASWAQEEGDETLVGPPSPDALAELKLLKDNYGWTITPDPFD